MLVETECFEAIDGRDTTNLPDLELMVHVTQFELTRGFTSNSISCKCFILSCSWDFQYQKVTIRLLYSPW